MRALRTIRLDVSDTFVFEKAALPGEYAVSGAFAFAHLDPATLTGKARAAFRGGFLGIDSLGWSTLVQIVDVTEAVRASAVELLAQRLVEHFGAPDLLTARTAAEDEIEFAAELAQNPIGLITAVSRTLESGSIKETYRSLRPVESKLPTAYGFLLAAQEPETSTEEVDLIGLARKGR